MHNDATWASHGRCVASQLLHGSVDTVGRVRVRVERLIWSERIVANIGSKLGLSVDDVEAAVFNVDAAWWDYLPERGRRLLVQGAE